jgi:hypothetical protein
MDPEILRSLRNVWHDRAVGIPGEMFTPPAGRMVLGKTKLVTTERAIRNYFPAHKRPRVAVKFVFDKVINGKRERPMMWPVEGDVKLQTSQVK